jgi:hypothetical protein
MTLIISSLVYLTDGQDSDDVDSELERSESETEITTPSYLKWQSFPEPGHDRGREKLSGSEHEVEAEESPRRGGSSRQIDTRPIESVADGIGGMKMASPTASGWSDGEYDYDYEDYDEDNYSSDDFDSFEDSGDLSMSGKRMNSPLRRPKSKDGTFPHCHQHRTLLRSFVFANRTVRKVFMENTSSSQGREARIYLFVVMVLLYVMIVRFVQDVIRFISVH